MTEKIDIAVDDTALSNVDAAVLAGLRVGQRLVVVAATADEAATTLSTEDGIRLAPLPPAAAERFPNPRVIIRAIKREAGTGTIQQLQVRVYRADGTEPTQAGGSHGTVAAQAGAAGTANPSSGAPTAAGDGAAGGHEEFEYKLRRSQYQALADSEELRGMLADPQLKAVLTGIDGAQDRERALAVQMEKPDIQGFVSQVLKCLDPERVPATAATAAAVAMATKP